MTTYATNNPIGSMDPKDLFDNAQNFDFALNDISQEIWKDRFGKERQTYWGMERSFSIQLGSQQQRFDYFIQNSGYKFVGEYTDGPLTISDFNQLIRYQNELYKLTADTVLPFTTTGNDATSWIIDSAHLVSVGDAALRQELVSPGGGNIPGWYDAPSSVRAANHKTPSNSWQDAINSARVASGANSPIVIGANATGAETVPVQYALPSGVSGYHLSQGTSEEPSTDKRPLILLEKVCDSLDSLGPHTMANYSMKYVGGVKGAIPLSSYIEASGTAEGGAIAIQGRAKTTVATSSGWGGWSYIDVQSILPVRAIGHEINVRCNIPSPLEWSASGGIVDGLVIATVDNGSNNMANSAIKVSRSSQGLGFLSGLRFGYRSIVPSDTSDMTKLNGEAILINGGSSNAERYGGIRIGANDGFGFTRFHYGLRTNEAEFNNNVAIWLGDNHRIRWGAQLSSGPYIHYNTTDLEMVGSSLNIANGLGSSLKTNGLKVIGVRATGIFQLTGTADGATKSTESMTLVELARYVKKVTDALISNHGLIGPT